MDTINRKYEKELLRMIARQQYSISRIFGDFTKEISPVLLKWRKQKGGVWHGNEQIRKELLRSLNKLRKDLRGFIGEQTSSAWLLSADKNDAFMDDFLKDITVPEFFTGKIMDRNLDVLKVFQKRIAGGMNLSQRVWVLTNDTKRQIEYFLQAGLTTGRSAPKLASDLKNYLVYPDKVFRRVRDKETGKLKLSRPAKNFHPGKGLYRSSYKNALRLAANETNMAYRFADHLRWKQNDAVLGFEVKLSNEHSYRMPDGDICDELAGIYPKGFKFVGWHPGCFCYAVPVLMSQKDFSRYLTGKLEPKTKYINNIPTRTKSYVKNNTERIDNWSSKPYWLKDNFKKVKGKYIPKAGVQN